MLGLDTSTPAITVAVFDGLDVLAESSTLDARRHGELLAPAIDDVLRAAGVTPADLTDVAVGVGPGPYTGLRVGVVTAAVLADALGIPAHGVCSLDIIAAQQPRQRLTVLTDARRREVFWAVYVDGERVDGPAVDRPADVAVVGRAVGPGAALYPEAFGDDIPDSYPTGADLCRLVSERLATGGELFPALPVYLRRPDTAAPRPPKSVSA
jgi:tRNA threonylcarbamoyladenosine biosynthesis protein TsaB